MENIHLLKEYFLPYASCIHCSKRFNELNSSTECSTSHKHAFTDFAVEPYMISIVMQQFLIDVNAKSRPKTMQSITNDSIMDVTSAPKTIDLKEIEQFWNDYVNAVPDDLEIIWDSIDSGLIRYLEVNLILVLALNLI